MSIRFKFRSSVNFDTLEIDGEKPYISVGEFRSKVLCQKKLNNVLLKDFDLVFSDALTGQEYNDDRFEIPSGSSVIVKRVPVEPVPAAMLRYQRLEANGLSDDNPKGLDHSKPERVVVEEKLEPEFDKQMKLEKVAAKNCLDLENIGAGLPTELKCPLCNTYFKEAVMIPCCGRSFCGKCIREVLVETGRCPICSSMEFKIEHLLPNYCLRQAIEHFLESQILATAPENDLQKYVPDGESGIQGKHISSAVPVPKRNLDFPDSQVGDQRFTFGNISKKVDRTCYKCGSPDHLIRDCPIASTRHPMSHTGEPMFQGGMPYYATPYWNGATFPQVNPYMNMYGSPGMMPFNGNMVHLTPYGVPHYFPSMYNSFPVPSGTMMGGPTFPVDTRSEQPLTHSALLEPHHGDYRRKVSSEKRERSFDYEDDSYHNRPRFDDPQRPSEYTSHRERRNPPSGSEESYDRKRQKIHGKKHSHSTHSGRDRSYHTDRSTSGVANVQDSYRRHKKHSRSSARREQSGSDSSWGHHKIEKEGGVKRKADSDVDSLHKHNGHLSGFEPSSSGDHHKKKLAPVYRESRERTNDVYRNRREMVKDSDGDSIEDPCHKRKKG